MPGHGLPDSHSSARPVINRRLGREVELSTDQWTARKHHESLPQFRCECRFQGLIVWNMFIRLLSAKSEC